DDVQNQIEIQVEPLGSQDGAGGGASRANKFRDVNLLGIERRFQIFQKCQIGPAAECLKVLVAQRLQAHQLTNQSSSRMRDDMELGAGREQIGEIERVPRGAFAQSTVLERQNPA